MVHKLNKGKAGEREVIKLLQPWVNEVCDFMEVDRLELERNLDQSKYGGYDIKGLDWLALEVKRQETLNINKWWEQTVKQTKSNQVGVLIYRQNRKQWKVVMIGQIGTSQKCRVQIDLDAFEIWFKDMVYADLRSRLQLD